MTRASALPIASAARLHVSAGFIPCPRMPSSSPSSPAHDFPDRDYGQRGRGSTRKQRSGTGFPGVLLLRNPGFPGTIPMGPPEISSLQALGGDTPLPHPGDESGMSPVNCVERNGSERSPFRGWRKSAASRRSGGAVRLSAAVQVYRTASHEQSPPPRLRSDSPPGARGAGSHARINCRIYEMNHFARKRRIPASRRFSR